MKKFIIIFIIVVLVGVGVYFIINNSFNDEISDNMTGEEDLTSIIGDDVNVDVIEVDSEDSNDNDQNIKTESIIGKSFNDYDIIAYHYGDGDKELIFVGGFHGGYEWNTSLVAYKMMDYLKNNESIVPDNLSVTIIPVLNPDGLVRVVGTTGRFLKSDVSSSQDEINSGRFNGNNVDLNRNFDCDWQSTGVWKDVAVDGGNIAFSEPESKAFRDYINISNPEAVVVWFSAADGVFASNCHEGVLDETLTITNLYAEASGYPAYEEFNFYEITGDAVNWLAKKNIPAISVLLSNHEDIEWDKNLAGIKSLFNYYSE